MKRGEGWGRGAPTKSPTKAGEACRCEGLLSPALSSKGREGESSAGGSTMMHPRITNTRVSGCNPCRKPYTDDSRFGQNQEPKQRNRNEQDSPWDLDHFRRAKPVRTRNGNAPQPKRPRHYPRLGLIPIHFPCWFRFERQSIGHNPLPRVWDDAHRRERHRRPLRCGNDLRATVGCQWCERARIQFSTDGPDNHLPHWYQCGHPCCYHGYVGGHYPRLPSRDV